MWNQTDRGLVYTICSDPPGRTINLVYINSTSYGQHETFIWSPKLRGTTPEALTESIRKGFVMGFRRVAVFDDLEQAKGAGLALYYMQDSEV